MAERGLAGGLGFSLVMAAGRDFAGKVKTPPPALSVSASGFSVWPGGSAAGGRGRGGRGAQVCRRRRSTWAAGSSYMA